MRTVKRPRHYVSRHWLALTRPFMRYSSSRDAYVLRVVGRRTGPVLRLDRRRGPRQRFEGVERRGASLTA
jgi:hypothetical protein